MEPPYLLADFNLIGPLGKAVLLVALGCVLLVSEAFFPSGGLLGLFSAVSLLAGVYYAYEAGGAVTGLSFALGALILAPVALMLGFRLLPLTAWGRALLGAPPEGEEVVAEDGRHALVGMLGVARSKMLPSGSVEVAGEVIDAVSQGQAIDPGERVRVVEVRGNRVVVRREGDADPRGAGAPTDPLARPANEFGLDDDLLG